MQGRSLTTKEKEEMRSLRKAGARIVDIAKRFRVSKRTVHNHLPKPLQEPPRAQEAPRQVQATLQAAQPPAAQEPPRQAAPEPVQGPQGPGEGDLPITDGDLEEEMPGLEEAVAAAPAPAANANASVPVPASSSSGALQKPDRATMAQAAGIILMTSEEMFFATYATKPLTELEKKKLGDAWTLVAFYYMPEMDEKLLAVMGLVSVHAIILASRKEDVERWVKHTQNPPANPAKPPA